MQLFTAIEEQSTPYTLTRSELNNQLRYIALIFSEQGQAANACEIMRSLCKQNPEMAELHREYAFALKANHQLEEAEIELNTALTLQPVNANCHAQLARIYCHTGRVSAGYNSYTKAATIAPSNPNFLQRLVNWSIYSESTGPQGHYQLARLWASRAFPGNRAGTNTWRTPQANRQLKIAFVSSGFARSSLACLISPLLKGLDRKSIHITVYSDSSMQDIDQSLRAHIDDDWQDSSLWSNKQLSTQISNDQIDVLINIDGHRDGSRLAVFSNHVAPIQLSWLGYPATTGLNSIDYRISDRVVDPIGLNEEYYTEKLLRLPNALLCYAPPATPSINPSEDQANIRFGSFIDLAKVSNLTLDCWAAAMHAVPNSSLCLKQEHLTNHNTHDYLLKQLSERGISSDRIISSPSTQSAEQHLNAYNHIDIALDSAPYNDAVSTLEALWMGVPVVSLQCQTACSRVSASILEQVQLGELATNSVAEYTHCILALSKSSDRRQQLRATLRKQMHQSQLTNAQQFGHDFGYAIRQKWLAWCQQRNQEQAQPNRAMSR